MSPLDTLAHTNFTRFIRQIASLGFKARSLSWEVHQHAKTTKEMAALQGHRNLGGKHSWVMKLDTAGVRDPGAPDHLLDNAAFELVITKRGSAVNYISLLCNGLRSPVLKNTYVYRRNRPNGIDFFCNTRLKELELMALSTLDVNNRPTEYNAIMQGTAVPNVAMGKFVISSWWQYYDDEVEPLFRGTPDKDDDEPP
jgi:hypothetical protein